MRSEKLEFEGSTGERLAARLDLPAGRPRAFALFAHCFTCSKDIAAARRISAGLAANGIAVLRFDFTGLGHSGGEFANTGFSSNVEDLLAAAAHLREHHAAPALLVGHSLGGAAVIAASPGIPEARAIVTIGAPHRPEHVLERLGAGLDMIERDGEAAIRLADRDFTIRRSFVEDVRSARLDDILGTLKKALLVMHAPMDEVVGIDNATAIFKAARHPKSFISLGDADHLLSRAEDAGYAAAMIAAWADKHLPVEARSGDNDGLAEGDVRVSEADATGFLQDVMAEGNRTLADEPASVGGLGLGFTPYQLVAAGLGACTSMTLRMYARRKKWPLEHVEVDVNHGKVHVEDCADPDAGCGKVDRFRRSIRILGDLDDEQRARLMEIAYKCPVHRTLEGEIRIETDERRDG
ncbi:MAG: alpha/beta fold hydrolase [Geminicoccaceae bacterium]